MMIIHRAIMTLRNQTIKKLNVVNLDTTARKPLLRNQKWKIKRGFLRFEGELSETLKPNRLFFK